MALTNSRMIGLGVEAPTFSLEDIASGQQISLQSFQEKQGLLVMFICRHCPFVKHVEQELARIGEDYKDSGLGIVAISSNDARRYPEDSPARLRQQAEEAGFSFSYCYDESQSVAKAYSAECTPDFFLFDADRRLVYRGQLDDSRPGNSVPVTGQDLRAAIDAVLAGKAVSQNQKPSVGCGIKWRD